MQQTCLYVNGSNGSGKSTTQKILNGVLKGYNGHVSIF
ncbi:ATP-binding cassette domain-containing protein, partial [Clostridioides difficile]